MGTSDQLIEVIKASVIRQNTSENKQINFYLQIILCIWGVCLVKVQFLPYFVKQPRL